MGLYPGDIESRRTDSRACAIVHYQIDSDVWDYKVITGCDVGTDCELEMSEDGEWRGKKIELQIKGTKHIDRYKIKKGAFISFGLDKKTIRYGLEKPTPFFLVVVDVEAEKAYFAELHQVFIADASLFDLLQKSTKSMSIHIPVESTLDKKGSTLIEEARKVYVGGATKELRAAQ